MNIYFCKSNKINFLKKYLLYRQIEDKQYLKKILKYPLMKRIDFFYYVYKKSVDKAQAVFDEIFKNEISINNSPVPSRFYKLAFSLKLNTPQISNKIIVDEFKDKNLTDCFYFLEVYKNHQFRIIDKLPNKQSLYQCIQNHYHCFNETLFTLNYSNKIFETATEPEHPDSLYENNIYSVIYKYYQTRKTDETNTEYENILKRHTPEDTFTGMVYINLLKHTYNSLGGNHFLPVKRREKCGDIILNCQKIINSVFNSEVITHEYLEHTFLNSLTKQFFAHKFFLPYKTSHDGVIINVYNTINQYTLHDYLSLFKTLKKEVSFIDFNSSIDNEENVHHFLIKFFLIQYKVNHTKDNKLFQYKSNNDAKTEILSIINDIQYSEKMYSFLKEHLMFIPSDFLELHSAIENLTIKIGTHAENNDLPRKRKRL